MIKIVKSVIKSVAKGLYHDPEIRAFLSRHPRFSAFMKKRLTPDEKYGLNLTVGSIITLIFVFLFFSIVRDVIGQEALIEADLRIINLVQIFRTSGVNNFMLVFTDLGKWQVIAVGTFGLGLILFLQKKFYYLWTLLVSVLGGEIFVLMAKNYFDRPRPDLNNALAYEKSFSFPSGHGFVSIAFFGLLVYFVFIGVRKKWPKILAAIFGVLVILLIGFSRVYLGVHWPSDVLASFASGAAWLTLLITVTEMRRRFNGKIVEPYIKKKNIYLIGIAAVLFFIASIVAVYKFYPLKEPVVINEKTQFIITSNVTDIFNKLPRTSEDITGKPMEPINIIIVGTKAELETAFIKAGWMSMDPLNRKTLWRAAIDSILNKPYPQAPGTPSFWNSVPNEIAFQQSTPDNSIRERHHVHFWETEYLTSDKLNIWVGTAHFDQGVKLSSNMYVPSHVIDPAVDKERDHIKMDILNTGLVKNAESWQIVEPTLGSNQAGDQFFTDGKTDIFYLE